MGAGLLPQLSPLGLRKLTKKEKNAIAQLLIAQPFPVVVAVLDSCISSCCCCC